MSQSVKINYYDTFKCIADQCSLTCCQEWRITVDEATKKKWVGHQIEDLEKNARVSLCGCLEDDEIGSVIKLGKDKKCPFLNQDKLCKLVIGLGEEFLSDTCATFPRQKNKFSGRVEHSLASCCPVVVDLMRKTTPQIIGNENIMCSEQEALLYEVREMMLSIMKKDDCTLPERMLMTFYALLELLEKKKLNKKQIQSMHTEKQLAPLLSAMRNMDFSKIDSILESNELFLDVVENYRKKGLYLNYLESIAQVAEKLEEDYTEEEIIKKQEAFEKDLMAHRLLLNHYLLAEIIGNSLMPDSELEDMVIAFEWITLEYSVIRQALFLKWLEQGEKSLPYETIRDYIAVIARVTGYEPSDIYEYLENSFEEMIWQWGYMAMVLGNGQI